MENSTHIAAIMTRIVTTNDFEVSSNGITVCGIEKYAIARAIGERICKKVSY
jgi:hypothetical protein